MKNTQREAREAGDIYYTTGKACTYGHYGARYTTSGNCVDCHVSKRASTPKKARNDMRGFSVMLTPEWHAAFTAAWEVVSMGTDEQRGNLRDIMQGVTVNLTRSGAVAAGITKDDADCIDGHEDYRDAGEEMHLRIAGKWYSELDLIDLFKGKLTSIKEVSQ